MDGIIVIRAQKKEGQTLAKAYSLFDKHSSAWFNFICVKRALCFFVDMMSAILISVSLMAMLAIFDPGEN